MNKKFILFVIAIVLLVSLSIYYLINFFPRTLPDNKGFVPVQIYFENNVQNLTLTPNSSTVMTTTLTSNLDKEITVAINPTLVALDNPPWINVSLNPNPITLNAFGTNVTSLTVQLAEDTPQNIQSDTLVLELDSVQYPNVRGWSVSLQIFVNSSFPSAFIPNQQNNASLITEEEARSIAMPYIDQYAKEYNRTIMTVTASFNPNVRDISGSRGGPSFFALTKQNISAAELQNITWLSFPQWSIDAMFETGEYQENNYSITLQGLTF